jgi:rubrerythrin
MRGDNAQAFGIDLPRQRCSECGYWFTTAGDMTVCPDCEENARAEREEGE